MRTVLASALLAAAAICACHLACRRPGAPVRSAPDVMIIGLDGADWDLMKPALDAGRLPNIARLALAGASGRLASFMPSKSPVLWTTIATGKAMDTHGIGAGPGGTDGARPFMASGAQRRVKAFWNILGERNIRVGVVNWWVTTPPEDVNGFMVSDAYRNGGPKPLTYPPELAAGLPVIGMTMDEYMEDRRAHGLNASVSSPVGSDEIVKSMYRTYKIHWEQDRAVHQSGLQLLASNDVGVFAVTYRIVDASSHLFWHEMDPAGMTDAAFGEILAPIYAYADSMIGDLLAAADPGATVIVCSDHGFDVQGGQYDHDNGDSSPDGVLILSGPPFAKGARIEGATLLDVLPTLLYAEGVPIGKDMDGKALLSAFTPEFVRSHEPLVVDTHDTGKPPKGSPVPPGEPTPQVLEQLRALGYVK